MGALLRAGFSFPRISKAKFSGATTALLWKNAFPSGTRQGIRGLMKSFFSFPRQFVHQLRERISTATRSKQSMAEQK
jgi:hypothetical protein